MLDFYWGDGVTEQVKMIDVNAIRICERGISLKEKITRKSLRLQIETAVGHEWHENMSAHTVIASLQPASFCFGTLLTLLMVYVGSRQA